MPGRRPPRITGRFVNTVTRGRVGVPHERAPFRSWRSRWFCRSMSVEDSQSRRFELTFGWDFLSPILAQDLPRNFSVFKTELELFFWRFVLIANGTEILWRVSFKFKVCLATSRSHCHWSKFPDFFPRNFLFFHIFHFSPQILECGALRFCPLLNFQTMTFRKTCESEY